MLRHSRLVSFIVVALVASCSSSNPGVRPSTGGAGPAAGTGGALGGAGAGSGAGGGGGVGVGGAGGGMAAGGKVGVSAPSLLNVVADRFPAAGATGVCADFQLRLTFMAPFAVGPSGTIQVWQDSAPGAPVDVIDLAAKTYDDLIGGRMFFQNRPVFVDGLQAIIYLHRSAKWVPGETYHVTIDSEVFTDMSGASLGHIAGASDWKFTTKAAAPALPDKLVVALDNSGDFCSVQGAIDFIPAANATPVTVLVKNGTYREIVFINTKHQITLQGEDRKRTIISYANNSALQNNGATSGTLARGTAFRAMVEVERSNDLIVENLTLYNTTPQNGSQAEAIRIDPGDRAILRNADFLSLQDTLLLSGRAYVYNSYIEGNVDFIWGTGTVYFDRCEIKTVGRKGYNVQARNATNRYGYVFVDSKLTSTAGIVGHYLARVDGVAYPGSHVAYINCEMGSHIDPTGWLLQNTVEAPMLRFWEYKSVDPAGVPVDISRRIAASRQLTDEEGAMMRDKTVVFGIPAWTPMP